MYSITHVYRNVVVYNYFTQLFLHNYFYMMKNSLEVSDLTTGLHANSLSSP